MFRKNSEKTSKPRDKDIQFAWLDFMQCNFPETPDALGMTPAMAAGLTDKKPDGF